MILVGITNNDLSGASLIDGETVRSAVSEERFNGIKDFKGWPQDSIDYVLRERGITLKDVDHICYGWSAGFSAERHLDLYLGRHALARDRGKVEEALFQERLAAEMQNDIPPRNEFDNWIDSHGLRGIAVYVDHHEAHAIGAFALSPFESGLAVSCDGRGDFQSLAVFAVENNKAKCLYRQSTLDSFGYLYGRVTKALGFLPNRHEGKILGLAANGGLSGALDELREIVQHENGKMSFKLGGIYAPFYDRHFDGMADLATRYSREDIAYAIQGVLVDSVTELIAHYLDRSQLTNVAVAGGVFTNVRLNQRIAELPSVANMFVLPCMGDGGLPLAASAAFCFQNQLPRPMLTTMALGPQIEEHRLVPRLTYNPPAELSAESHDHHKLIADALEVLESGGIVGLFRGRSEFGPRALCNRTLLALPSIQGISAVLNRRLKRSDFMPFAPVIASDFADRCLEGWTERDINSLYMTQTFSCTEEFKRSCPEVVHVDGTSRPEVIWPERDAFMHSLLMAVHRRTGSLSLINTSFNVHESPIVGSLETAMNAVRDGVCDLLLVNDLYTIRPVRAARTAA